MSAGSLTSWIVGFALTLAASWALLMWRTGGGL
jgi:hypothetical protein